MRIVKIGDTVYYKPYGNSEALVSTVTDIEVCRGERNYGTSVPMCDLDTHSNVVIDLEKELWCNKKQVVKIISN